MKRWSGSALPLIAGACVAFACGQAPRPKAAMRELGVSRADGFTAGVATADVTPPLHLSLYGHGPESRIATGVRLRLRCQAFVIARANEVVALVPCDLHSVSKALHDAVAQRLRENGVPIRADQLYLMATHTHAGPAHYFDARHYHGPFSSSAPGYDPEVVEFLADRIAASVVQAFSSLAPACIGWRTQEVYGLTMNRSFMPFRTNGRDPRDGEDPVLLAKQFEQRERAALAAPGAQAAPPCKPDADAIAVLEATSVEQTAVDPQLTVLRVDRRADGELTCSGSTPMGVLAIFGMHPTGVPNTTELYSGDVFGFAVRAAEDPLASAWAAEAAPPSGAPVIVGLANGVEGDVSPAIYIQSQRAARAHGRKLGALIATLASAEGGLAADGPLVHLFWDLYFPRGRAGDKPKSVLCDAPELGSTMAGGVHDGYTRLRAIPEANAGFRPEKAEGCHGLKLPIRFMVEPSYYAFPRYAPLGLVRIGSGVIATAPGEMTTMTGRRIHQRVRTALSGLPEEHKVDVLALVGLTNQYMQYFATPEEYVHQHYEGASTLYGPNTQDFLARHFEMLARTLVSGQRPPRGQRPLNDATPFKSCDVPTTARWPSDHAPDPRNLVTWEVERVVRDGDRGWEIQIDRLPVTFTTDRGELAVEIVMRRGGRDVVVDDDRGATIEVRELDDDGWRIRWTPQIARHDPRCGQSYRIRVTGRFRLESKLFELECAPADVRDCEQP